MRKLPEKIIFLKSEEKSIQKIWNSLLESNHPMAQVSKIALAIGAIGATLFVGAVAPNALRLLGVPKSKKGMALEEFREYCRLLRQLRQNKWIEYVKTEGNNDIYQVTKKGKQVLRKLSIEALVIKRPKIWDGKWRVLIFDIPHSKKAAREALRDKIRELGFFQLQKSVWIYPFPCEEELLYIADVFTVRRHIEILIVDSITNHRAIQYFYPILRTYRLKTYKA